jgi:predicted dehydrogenase
MALTTMNRRLFLQAASAGLLQASAARGKQYRIVLIGDTAHGNYGHDWDLAWKTSPKAEVVAVADPDESGRRRAMARSGAARGYGDYREMLVKEKPDIVTICTRWPDHRVPMLTAAAEAGANVLTEKPFARTLEEADTMLALAERSGIKVQVGHPYRAMPIMARVRQLLRDGELGNLMEIRARGKEDRRAGGEDLMVLGTHYLDLMRYFAGDPKWVFAEVTEHGKPVRVGRRASEPVGLVAGDDVAAMFSFGMGAHGYLASKATDVQTGKRFGFTLYGSKGVIHLPSGGTPRLLRSEAWIGGENPTAWETIESGEKADTHEQTSSRMAADLLDAIEQKREPICSARDGLWTVEMVTGIYQSSFSGKQISFPLVDRRSPLREA